MHPLILVPLYRRFLWGGRRFATLLHRDLPAGDDYAESWELVDRGPDQSVVAAGPLCGTTLGDIVKRHGRELLGRHHTTTASFPLLFKYLDAQRDLSIQVHPDDARAALLVPPDRGKTEAWYVIDAVAGSRIYAGLRAGVDRPALADAVRSGRCEAVLHSFEPQPGDCVFIPAGTVHALGAGLVIAEIQQASDVTYRLHDWNRVGADGRPRPLHIDAGLEAVTRLGPVWPMPRESHADQPGIAACRRRVACEFFALDEVTPATGWLVGGDDASHFLTVVSGTASLDAAWRLPPLGTGTSVLMPASIGAQQVMAEVGRERETRLLHVSLP